MVQEKFEDFITEKQPKNIIKLTLTNEDTGEIDKEIEIENTVGLLSSQRANMLYKGMATYNYWGLGTPQVGSSGMYLVVRSWKPGVTSDNAYFYMDTGYYPYYSINDAADTTAGSTFYVQSVLDSTHLLLTQNPIYFNVAVGHTITQKAVVRDTTSLSAFTITTIGGPNSLTVSDTSGINNGDTITQAATSTTTTVTAQPVDSTHLTVANTAGFATTVSTTVSAINTPSTNAIQVASTTGWSGANQESRGWTAYNYQNALSLNGSATGIYLPQLSGQQRNRGYTWTYEWGTTQGNGTLASVAFQDGNSVTYYSQGGGMIPAGVVPELAGSGAWTYAGWKDVGPVHQLYFVNPNLTNNNVVVINAADQSFISQGTITNPTGFYSSYQHPIIYTPANGGWFYGIVTYDGHHFTYKKAQESGSMTFGGNVVTASFSVPGWYNGGYWTVYNVTSDQQFIYLMVYDYQNYQWGIMTFDPNTDTIVGVNKVPAGFGGAGSTDLFNICPFTGKVFTDNSVSSWVIYEWPSISQPELQRAVASIPYGTPQYYYRNLMMEVAPDKLVFKYTQENTYYGAFFEVCKGGFHTYSELPIVLTKANNQSLRVSYTLNWV